VQLAKDLGIEVGDGRDAGKKGEPQAAYDYFDGQGKLLYQIVRFPPKKFLCRRPVGGGWKWGRGEANLVLYNLPELAKRLDDDVYIVEGEKDANRLAVLGLLSTTCPHGAGTWKDDYAEPLRGRNIIIIPDNDGPGRDHARAVIEGLEGTAKSIKVITLPDLDKGGDVSDWLDNGHTADELAKIVKKTPKVGVMPTVRSKNKTSKIREAVINTLVPDIACLTGEDNRLYMRAEVGWKRMKYVELYRKIASLVFSFSGNYPSNNTVSELARMVTMLVERDVSYTDLPTVALNDRLVSLDPSTGEVVDGEPTGVFPHIAYDYLPDPEPVEWLRFLSTIVEDNTLLSILQEFLGMALFPNYNPQKALLLIGPGANGKTTLLNVLSQLFKSYTSSVNINTLEDARMVDALDGALLNVSEETLSDKVVSAAGFKAVTADSLMMANPKYQPPYTIRPTAQWMIATNGFPLFDETTKALLRRMLFLPMEHVIPVRERRALTEILANLRPERDHIVSWMLQGAQRYFAQHKTFTYSAKSEQYLDDWRKENSPIMYWLDDEDVLPDAYRIATLYERFKSWSNFNGFRQMSIKSFSRRLEELGFIREHRRNGNWVILTNTQHQLFMESLKELE